MNDDYLMSLTGSAKILQLMTSEYTNLKLHVEQLLANCQRLTICLDGWTTKGMTSSYLAISACFFDTMSHLAKHATLNITALPHPHTGEALAQALQKTMTDWKILANKILLVVTDNGSNIVKAVRLLQEQEQKRLNAEKVSRQNDHDGVFSESTAEDSTSDEEMSDTVNEMSYSETSDLERAETKNGTTDGSALNVAPGVNDVESNDEDTDTETDLASHMALSDNIPYRRMQCMARTLQLVVKQVTKVSMQMS